MLSRQRKIEENPDWGKLDIVDVHTSKERQSIYCFRYQIYVEEMKRKVHDVDHHKKWITDSLDSWSCLIYAQIDGHIVGTARVTIGGAGDFPDELNKIFKLGRFEEFAPGSKNMCFVTKVMVHPEMRGTPVFFRLMARIYEIMRQQNVQFCFGGCNPYLIPMYEQMGYRQIAEGFQDPGYGFVVPILFLTEDVDHLTAVRSPYLRIARKLHNSAAAKEWLQVYYPDVLSYPVSLLTGEQESWEYAVQRAGEQLADLPALKNLNKEEARQLLHIAAPVKCSRGQYFIRRGDVCDELNILIAGEMEVIERRGRKFPIGLGEVVGSVGLSGQTHHNIDAIAVSDCEVMAVARCSFEKLQRSWPQLADKLLIDKLCKEEQ